MYIDHLQKETFEVNREKLKNNSFLQTTVGI